MGVAASTRTRPLRAKAQLSRATRFQLFFSGCLAALITVVAMFVLRELTGRDSLVELIAQTILQSMPSGLFAFLLDLLQETAKPALLAAVMLGIIIAGGFIAKIDGGPSGVTTMRRRFSRVVWLAGGLWLPMSIFAVLVTSYASVEGVSNRGLFVICLDLLMISLVYAIGLYALFPLVRRAAPLRGISGEIDEPPDDLGRRRLIAQAGVALVGLAGVSYLGNILNGITGGSFAGGKGVIPPPVTPTDQFYLISKNFLDPEVDEGAWELEITGAVANPVTISYIDVLQLPSVEQQTTLTCISNKVGGDLISNANWTGVTLAQLIARAGLRPEAAELAIYAHDGYTESFPLSKALEPTTLAVYLMNGEQLTKRHGYPVRLIVPGKYGIKNVKWVRKIELISGDFKGYWQRRGWTDEATIKTMSRIDVPGSRAIVSGGPREIGGIAFAGDRGISKVEYSVDGRDWREAELQQVAPLSWVIWRSTWNPPGPGTYSLTVRATDGLGEQQTEQTAPPIPDGASGLHTVEVGVT
jgi:hypothetical protein